MTDGLWHLVKEIGNILCPETGTNQKLLKAKTLGEALQTGPTGDNGGARSRLHARPYMAAIE